MKEFLFKLEKIEHRLTRLLANFSVLLLCLVLLFMVLRIILRDVYNEILGAEVFSSLLMGMMALLISSEDVARKIYKSLLPNSVLLSHRKKKQVMLFFECLELAFSIFVLCIGGSTLFFIELSLGARLIVLLFYGLVPVCGMINIFFSSINLLRIYLFQDPDIEE